MGKRQRFEYKNALIGYASKAAMNYAKNYAKRSFKRSFKRRRVTRRRIPYRKLNPHKGPLTKRKIKKKLKSICQFMKQQEAVHIHRVRFTDRLLCGVNTATYFECVTGGSINNHESAMANLRFFDPATNALVTANPATGTYHRDIRMSIFRTILVRNNYQIPVKVDVWSCVPKEDTNGLPTAFIDSGLLDQGGVSKSSPLVMPKDSKQLGAMWTLSKKKSMVLAPGRSCYGSSFKKLFKYDFDSVDMHTLSYQKKYGGHCWMVRVHGVLGHDSVLDEQTLTQGGVDIQCNANYTFKYDAGKDLHDITLNDASGVFTNTGLVSQKPIADNQGYALA